MKKIKSFLGFALGLMFCIIPNVNAEVPTGEQYSEFATHKVELLQILTSSSNVMLYGYDYSGFEPSLSSFITGTTSLVRYYDNTNDDYGNWAIRIFQSSRSSGTYNLSWRVTFDSASNATSFCTRISNPSPKGGTTNSYTCSTNSNTAYLLVNYDLNNADSGTSYFDFDIGTSKEGISLNWFMRLATAVYYPQITPSDKFDTSGLESQNQIIINQNQTTISQNNTIIDQNNKTNQELGELNDNITSTDGPTNLGALDNSAGWLPAGPVDSILNLPLSLINSLLSAISSTCQPLNIIFPFVNINYQLPCISTIYSRINGLNAIIDLIGFTVGVLILYYYFKHLYKWIDNKLSMDNDDDWGGI